VEQSDDSQQRYGLRTVVRTRITVSCFFLLTYSFCGNVDFENFGSLMVWKKWKKRKACGFARKAVSSSLCNSIDCRQTNDIAVLAIKLQFSVENKIYKKDYQRQQLLQLFFYYEKRILLKAIFSNTQIPPMTSSAPLVYSHHHCSKYQIIWPPKDPSHISPPPRPMAAQRSTTSGACRRASGCSRKRLASCSARSPSCE
jgi:hypothetical protein